MIGNRTNHDTDIYYWSLPNSREFLPIDEAIAPASGASLEGKAKFPIWTLEEDGHLQFRLSHQPSSIFDGQRGPHRLGYHGAHGHQATIEHQALRLWQRPDLEMRGCGIDDEEATFDTRVGQDPVRGDLVAHQQTKKVLLGHTAVEGSGYVPVDEKGLCQWIKKTGKKRIQ
jgi:hypothetical protein